MEVNTLTMELESKGISHTEGGWPKDINHLDLDHVVRYRKKIEKDVSYVNVITTLGAVSSQQMASHTRTDCVTRHFVVSSCLSAAFRVPWQRWNCLGRGTSSFSSKHLPQ